MNKSDIRNTITSLESIEDLETWINSQSKESLQQTLLRMFDDVLEYKDANEWNEAVKLCEALAIVGWGKRETVDAISRYNGDCWETKFITNKGENRYLFGRWSKKKKGWDLWNPEYFYSPDFVNKPSVNWQDYENNDLPLVQCEKLYSQRNYRRQMPIIMGQIGGTDRVSNSVTKMKFELTEHLYSNLRPSKYGKAVEKIFITLYCPSLSGSSESGLKIGAFNTKQKALYSKLYFDDKFGNLSHQEQRDYFTNNLLAAIDGLGSKLKKKKIEYDIQILISDVKKAIKIWNSQKS